MNSSSFFLQFMYYKKYYLNFSKNNVENRPHFFTVSLIWITFFPFPFFPSPFFFLVVLTLRVFSELLKTISSMLVHTCQTIVNSFLETLLSQCLCCARFGSLSFKRANLKSLRIRQTNFSFHSRVSFYCMLRDVANLLP